MASAKTKIGLLGEVMVELAPAGSSSANQFSLGVAGDTFNTAVALSRLGLNVNYITRLGDDSLSSRVFQCMADERVDSALVERVPGRLPGLYMIFNDDSGERTFQYWRGEAPAREMLKDEAAHQQLAKKMAGMDALYFSGISLAILKPDARQRLLQLAQQLQDQGTTIVFDPNYRPRLWESVEAAQQVIAQAMQIAHICLVTYEDEQMLWNRHSEAEFFVACRPEAEVVLKRGAQPLMILSEGRLIELPVQPVENILDTSGAGDAFNAGYLSARLAGHSVEESALRGNRVAALTIQHRGALVDRNIFLQSLT